MRPQTLWTARHVCWQCQWRLRTSRINLRQIRTRSAASTIKSTRSPQRAFHLTTTRPQQLSATPSTAPPTFDPALIPRPTQLPFRSHLVEWQQDHGKPSEDVLSSFRNHPANEDVRNGMSKLNSSSKSDEDIDTPNVDAMDEEEGEDLITIGLFLKPGDVVELRSPGREPVLAVFVQQLDSKSQFFSVNGRWCHSTLNRVAFAITGCIDPALLDPIIPFMPTNPDKADPKGELHIPIELGSPVLKILEGMTYEAEQIYRAHAPVLDTAYAVLADAKRTRMMTLSQITKTLLAQNDPAWRPSPAALLAVRKSLLHNEFRFRCDLRTHRLTNVFAIRPKNDVEVVETVHEWIREYRDFLATSASTDQGASKKRSQGVTYIEDFLAKARRLIALSRTNREPNRGVAGPSKKVTLSRVEKSPGLEYVWGERFSHSDKKIIDFLQAWVLTMQYAGISGLHAACASLVMATGCYEPGAVQSNGFPEDDAFEIRRSTGMLFLQEIGVISPYENRTLYDEQLMLPTVKLSRNLELLNTKAELTRKNPDFRDSMAHLRRDWGSTTVYCIDDAGAQEIDDGVSIERIEGGTSEFWIHVHVANPTAFFDKTHTLSGLAAHMTETFYTPERAYPMLPAWAAGGHFSLGRDRPVLTFSSRIDAGGNVLESKIQSGTVHNIVTITPSQMSSLLGHQTTMETRRFVVGGEPRISDALASAPAVSAEQLRDLQDMYTAAQRLWEKRKAAGAIRLNRVKNHVRLFESPDRAGLAWNPPSTDRSRLVQGDPIIEVTNSVRQSWLDLGGTKPSHIVEEMMILACSTAASWCTERKIPVIFRGTIAMPNSDASSSEESKLREMLSRLEQQQDRASYKLISQYMNSLGRAISHSSPLPHRIIAVPGYVRVTSPLRRFSDMIAHWQIEAALRYEAHTGKQFDANVASTGGRGILPFTKRQMQESIVTLSPRERLIASTKRTSETFWSTLALHRAYYYKEASLPETFKFWVRTPPGESPLTWAGATGSLPEYGFGALVDCGPEDMQAGDEWEVRLAWIDVFNRLIFVKPVQLLQRANDQL
ncbi:hypothetical protein HBI74_014200 [Parastagonospora nodorum]|nr:hypothetical protein HBI74_014200 [Parastagonospora nodorum]